MLSDYCDFIGEKVKAACKSEIAIDDIVHQILKQIYAGKYDFELSINLLHSIYMFYCSLGDPCCTYVSCVSLVESLLDHFDVSDDVKVASVVIPSIEPRLAKRSCAAVEEVNDPIRERLEDLIIKYSTLVEKCGCTDCDALKACFGKDSVAGDCSSSCSSSSCMAN